MVVNTWLASAAAAAAAALASSRMAELFMTCPAEDAGVAAGGDDDSTHGRADEQAVVVVAERDVASGVVCDTDGVGEGIGERVVDDEGGRNEDVGCGCSNRKVRSIRLVRVIVCTGTGTQRV